MEVRVFSRFLFSECLFLKKHLQNWVRNITTIAEFPNGSECQSQDVKEFGALIKDRESEEKIKLILMEFYFLKQVHPYIPDTLTERDMQNLLTMPAANSRAHYMTKYLSKVTKIELKRKFKVSKIALTAELEKLLDDSPKEITYKLGYNSLHLRFNSNETRSFSASRLAQAAIYGQPIVFDCGFDEYMNAHECLNTARMLQTVYGTNLVNRNPFDLYFCNLKSHDRPINLLKDLERVLPNTLYCPKSMITVSQKSYLDLFPDKNKLVYLSPNAKDTMEFLDTDAIYIIGAIVDKGPKVTRTLNKATEDEIRCQKLPLKKYLNLAVSASLNLPLKQVFHMLLELNNSGKWTKALKHFPNRFVSSIKEEVS